MKQVLLGDLREGELFVLTDKVKHNADGEVLSKYVYIKDTEYYYRGEKRCAVCKFDDINSWRELKGNRIVWADFVF
jgi:hypothetical protein